MSDTPASGTLGAVGILTAAFQSGVDDLTDAVRQLPGGSPLQALTISAGVVTPVDGASLLLRLDTEASAATDELTNVALTNVQDGALVIIQGTDNARVITIQNSGNLVTADGNDFVLTTTTVIWAGYVDGSSIKELFRSFGDQASAARTFLGLGTAAVLNTGTGGSDLPDNDDILGLATIYIPADTMRPQTTNGCAAVAQVEITAQQPERISLDFDGTSDEFSIFNIPLPKSWDKGTVQARFYYTVAAAVGTTVRFGLQGVSRADGEAIATTYGTVQEVEDTFGGTANLQAITGLTPAITIGGSPADDEMIYWRVGRDPDNDTTTEDAHLIGVEIFFTEDKLNDD